MLNRPTQPNEHPAHQPITDATDRYLDLLRAIQASCTPRDPRFRREPMTDVPPKIDALAQIAAYASPETVDLTMEHVTKQDSGVFLSLCIHYAVQSGRRHMIEYLCNKYGAQSML